jgi:hypothetical protein
MEAGGVSASPARVRWGVKPFELDDFMQCEKTTWTAIYTRIVMSPEY